ncbi:MAG: 4-hydroxy-tetrahydrodipicolinate reductase [Bacteroidia bacterium]
MLKIALVGYGKMGKAIEQETLKRGHQISSVIDLNNIDDIQKLNPENTDVVIEFTHPDSFQNNLNALLKQQVPIVSGTTGWYDRLEEVKQIVNATEGGFMFSSNFSIGVNILFKLNRELARIMNQYPEYDCFIEERHHRHKADGPSGTAHSLAIQVLEELDRKTTVTDASIRHRPPKPDELSVGFVRSGEIIGRHQVTYTSDIDEITLFHSAHNRRGFALGAVVAAEWMRGKKGFYEFSDIF